MRGNLNLGEFNVLKFKFNIKIKFKFKIKHWVSLMF